MAFTQPWFDVNFGSAYAGLGTVGYRLYNASGGDAVARTTTGVVDLTNGSYGVANVAVPDAAVGIQWDTGGGSPVYTVEDIDLYRKANEGRIVDGTITDLETLKIVLAALAGKATGGGGTIISFRDVGDTQTVLQMTVDVNGNRSLIVLNP